MFVQFVHRLDVGIGLASTRFHFDGEVYALTLQMIDRLQTLFHLDGTHIILNIATVEGKRCIAKAHCLKGFDLLTFSSIHDIINAIVIGLSLKGTHHIASCLYLKTLMFKF